jgi:DNA polymerase III delta subunit
MCLSGFWEFNMLTVIHGTDIVASRKFFLESKLSHPEAVSLDAESVNLTDLAQVIEGGGLFGETKHIFIEQFLSKRKKSGDYKEIIAYLDVHADEHAIMLWENKELDIATQKTFKRASFRPFKLPQTLFAMMDNIKPGNGKQLVAQFHQTIVDTEVEMVFFMIIRQIRMLLALLSSASSEIDEVKRLTWQRNKMQQQAAKFTETELIGLYNKLFAIEKAQKTGTLSAPLATTIDFFLLEI